MWWHFALIFIFAFLFDVVPFPFPPAFTVMILLQVMFDMDIWMVIIVGVMGSILGRYILTLYIPYFADRIFKTSKNLDVEYLGQKMKEKGWKSQVVIVAYSLLPLPTTPLFLASGMAKIKPIYIIPAFFVGKFISDAIVVHIGNYTSENAQGIIHGALSVKSILSIVLGGVMVCLLLFVDWRSLIQHKKFSFKFNIFK
jgi:membrane protein YqaA with SNARE-associated domain